MSRAVVNAGDVYGRWTILEEVESKTKHRRVMCRCECGTKRVVLLQALRQGDSKSCGCRNFGGKQAARVLYKELFERRKRGKLETSS